VSKARLVITAVVVEGRRPAEVAASYGVSRSSVYELVARYRVEGDAAFEPRSRRPKRSPRATPPATLELIAELRQRLTAQGLDAGSDTIRWHLDQHHHIRASRATIDRHLRRAGHAATQRRAVSAHSRRTRRLSHALDRRHDRPGSTDSSKPVW